jgi:cytosine/adenosine deaminase-related metal-dependent hydrolase
MSRRLISATRIHDGKQFLPEGSLLEIGLDGRVEGIHAPGTFEGTEHHEGVLCPGFVNVHCHLELSHMKGAIPESTGLMAFLLAVVRQRGGLSDHEKQQARHAAYEELLRNGVVAVGDIANTNDVLDLRARGEMHFHTFVECLGFTETQAQSRLSHSRNIWKIYAEQEEISGIQLRQSIVPHAPYSVSPELFRLINAEAPESLLSIHNQECAAENEYYRNKGGAVEMFFQQIGIDDSFFEATGCTSLQAYLSLIDESHPLILVHNTCTEESDLEFVKTRKQSTFWCLCPGANLYIEERLPDVMILKNHQQKICIGTDSLASNHQLNPLKELTILKKNFPELEWDELIRWATKNGAEALQMEEWVGTFKPGIKPGVLLLTELEGNGNVQRLW